MTTDILGESILETIRNMLGPSADYEHFDPEIVPHINSAFNRLKQLKVGPEEGFIITGADETWEDFFRGNPIIPMVVSYVFFKVKMSFDPPSSSIASESYKSMISEYEWCMNVDAESESLGGSD